MIASILTDYLRMKKIIFIAIAICFFCYGAIAQQVDAIEQHGYICLEMESTKSPLDQWVKIEAGNPLHVPTVSGGVFLEFTGNAPAGGGAKSPISFTFTINTAGTYGLSIKSTKRLEGELDDKCNDCFVKMAGDFSSPYTGDPKLLPDYAGLSRNEKIFGGNAYPKFGWTNTLDYLGHIKVKPRYVFKAGQTYTVTFSGRSQRFGVDYFILYNESLFPKPADAQSVITPASNGPIISNTKRINAESQTKLYPNPAKDKVNFSKLVDANFYNFIGQKVLSVNKSSEADVTNLSAGIYFVEIEKSGSQKLTIK